MDVAGVDEDYEAQIASLQAKQAAKIAKIQREQAAEAKERAKVLVQASPAKKRPAFDKPKPPVSIKKPNLIPKQDLRSHQSPSGPLKPPSSNLAASLVASRSALTDDRPRVQVDRSSSFTQQVVKPEAQPEEGEAADWGQSGRDENSLTVKEELTPGPKDFGLDTEGLNEWRAVEPNSGIRLSKRQLSHSLLQAHLDARYYLPPSLLYSIIRLSRDAKSYDVPVEGDWVTIAVVAERSDIRTTSGDPSFGSKQEDDQEDVVASDDELKPTVDKHGNTKRGQKPQRKRKFLSVTLCSLPPRSAKSSGISAAGGDALLKLLLFEAESVTKLTDGTKQYRGGSGGAFEKWSTLSVGSVIAILNPRVLRPMKGGSTNPHPLTLPLALNPTSAESVTLIGQARDIGICRAMRKDGNRCTCWVDTRVTSVCDYHLQTAVKEGRNGRAEFSSNTATINLATRGIGGRTPFINKSGSAPDPSKKWGLLPKNNVHVAPQLGSDGGGGATYIVGGNVVSTDKTKRFEQEMIAEKFGRGKQGREKRKREEQEAERELQKLLEQDSGGLSMGAKYLREAQRSAKGKERAASGQGKAPAEPETSDDRKRPFSVEAVRRIGFNPTVKGSAANVGESADAARKRIDSIMELQHHKPKLGRMPGTKVRSGVIAPKLSPATTTASNPQPPASFLDTVHPSTDMIDLDSSDMEN